MRAAKHVIAASAVAVLALATFDARAGCESDAQCKGDRICEDGTCVEPPAPVAPAPEAPPPEPVVVPPPPPAPAIAPSYPPQPDTWQPRTERKGILGLIIAGPILLGVTWLTTIGVTAGLDSDGDIIGYSAIPIAGPWVMMADDRTSDYTAPIAVSGVLQLGGLAMLIIGVSVKRDVPIEHGDPIELELTPVASPNLAGLALSGRF